MVVNILIVRNNFPRESATFAELQRMMTDSDKDLMDDDDTDSFEALESRLRTPYKKRPSTLVEDKNENHDESGIEVLVVTLSLSTGTFQTFCCY